jgi:hypothetical protein
MNRRDLLASLLLSPLTRLLGRRAPTPPIQRHPALADAHKAGRLPEVRWDSLDAEQQAILLRGTESFDGAVGAVCSWDFPSDPRWNASASIYTAKRMAVYDSLFRLGLLTFTSKMPEHEYDLCGWYTISQYGREIVLANLDLT